MLNLVDFSVGGFPLLFIGLIELIAINWVYGELKLKQQQQQQHKHTHNTHAPPPPPHTHHTNTQIYNVHAKTTTTKKQISILHFIFHRITIV